MKTVAIIAEYNPFHNGHLFQINKIREEFGNDTQIIAIMSGNYVQRGEMAILDKWQRAKTAVMCGINLVIELPFPYSISSAEFFSRGAINILNSLGVVDILSFGSECGDINALIEVARNMSKKEFNDCVLDLSKNEEYNNIGYAKICELAYNKVFKNSGIAWLPNNILALEYIKALIETNSDIKPHTIKRNGSDYNENAITSDAFQSATALREVMRKSFELAKEYIPEVAYNIYFENKNCGRMPINQDLISAAILAELRLNTHKAGCEIHDAKGGLYNRLVAKAYDATTISNLIDISATKKYTVARTRRAIWYSYFTVTSSDVRSTPLYTQVLGVDKIGQALLKKIKKVGKILVLVKPSLKSDNEALERQRALSRNADFLFEAAKPIPSPASTVYRMTPFIKDK